MPSSNNSTFIVTINLFNHSFHQIKKSSTLSTDETSGVIDTSLTRLNTGSTFWTPLIREITTATSNVSGMSCRNKGVEDLRTHVLRYKHVGVTKEQPAAA